MKKHKITAKYNNNVLGYYYACCDDDPILILSSVEEVYGMLLDQLYSTFCSEVVEYPEGFEDLSYEGQNRILEDNFSEFSNNLTLDSNEVDEFDEDFEIILNQNEE